MHKSSKQGFHLQNTEQKDFIMAACVPFAHLCKTSYSQSKTYA